MRWKAQQLESAKGKYLYFPNRKTTCLLQKSGTGWKIGVALNEQYSLLSLNCGRWLGAGRGLTPC
ncbi:hypothetical protein AVDCRST_MAG94-4229 [uncultured Leptolyngbya sp.]|uniref:Uncharacterized protein n=2 Tax=Cyanophyceae TaxID=3028117 RepID=A0A6J4MXZ7_9CYAN|nr:hypothetical protein AVDCRST_MAG94-4229 [uncultured Leptolyngbya sp.]CAA9556099.1 hypothetical protein AVDCRST_MAG81-211 [uncultured Synechococcales cyanobacterium]